jgi:hypothetical protein
MMSADVFDLERTIHFLINSSKKRLTKEETFTYSITAITTGR